MKRRLSRKLLTCLVEGLIVLLVLAGFTWYKMRDFWSSASTITEPFDFEPSKWIPTPTGAKVLISKRRSLDYGQSGWDEYVRLQCPGSARQIMQWCKRKLEAGASWEQVSEPEWIPKLQKADETKKTESLIDPDPMEKFFLTPTEGRWVMHAEDSFSSLYVCAYQQGNQVIVEYKHRNPGS